LGGGNMTLAPQARSVTLSVPNHGKVIVTHSVEGELHHVEYADEGGNQVLVGGKPSRVPGGARIVCTGKSPEEARNEMRNCLKRKFDALGQTVSDSTSDSARLKAVSAPQN
jgi:hypothetical protein